MTRLRISEDAIRALAGEDIFARGLEYCHGGAVSDLTLRGNELSADVHGSDYNPYQVTIHLHDGGMAGAHCTCPYDWGDYCKHIVAVLLTFSRDPASAVERRPVVEILRGLERHDLLDLLESRLESDPGLGRWIEEQLDAAAKADKAPPPAHQRPAVDSEPIRKQVRLLLSGGYRRERYWDGYSASGDGDYLRRLVAKAVPFLEAGDGPNALRILEPIAEEFLGSWIEYSNHDEDMYLLFHDLGRLMAEAALMSDLAPEARNDLAETLRDWQDQLDNYGVNDSFEAAIRALESGWDEVGLWEVMSGTGKSWPLTGASNETEDELTAARLQVLEAYGRHDEYLNLARAAGRLESYTILLVKLGRAGEAVDFALSAFKRPGEALSLATALRDAGAHEEALKIGEAGLGLTSPDQSDLRGAASPLAHWLRDYAAGLGRLELALAAGCVAFSGTTSLEDYQAVRKWAGERWPEVRPGLLARLASGPFSFDRIKIYLSEGMIDEAVRCVDKERYLGFYGDSLMELAEVAHASHSAWVIRLAQAQADEIMDANKSQRYEHAARWLQAAGRAYRASGQADEWASILSGLIAKHRRKPKLRPLLEALQRDTHA